MMLLMVLRIALCGVIAVGIFAIVFAVLGSPSYEAEGLGYRGMKRQTSIDEGGVWSQVEPLVRWFAARVKGYLPADFRMHIDEQLVRAGEYLGINPEEFVGLSIVGAIGGLVFGAVFSYVTDVGPLLVVICAAVGTFLPYINLTSEADRRLVQIARGLPAVTDLLALAMGAGLDFPGALRSVIEKWSDPKDAVVEEFRRIQYELRIGRTRKEALQDFASRIPLDPVLQFTGSVIQAEERGNPLADVLQVQAGMARMHRSVKAEEAASKAGVAMAAPLFLLFFCILLLVVAPMVMQLKEGL